jgi:rubrerythrin
VNRRALLWRAALLWTAVPAAPALAQGFDDQATANDAEVLNFALQLEELQASLYRAALELDLGPGLRSLVTEYAAHGREHVDVLTRELGKLGSEPEERPRFGFELADRDDFRRVARRVEDIVVGAYNGAIPSVLSSHVRVLLARIVHVEAQHAASFASAGQPAAPRGFDEVLSQTVVVQRIERYVRA